MKKRIVTTSASLSLLLLFSNSYAEDIPGVYSNIVEENGILTFINSDNKKYPLNMIKATYTRAKLIGNPKGNDNGLTFHFPGMDGGKLYYGFINKSDEYPQPVYQGFLPIENGKVNVDILNKMSGKKDAIKWKETGKGVLGYRLVDKKGAILFDGKVAFTGKGPFQINTGSIVEGPLVHFSKEGTYDKTIRISFDTLEKTTAVVELEKGQSFKSETPATHHEITLTGLKGDTSYKYTIKTQQEKNVYEESYSFKTAPSAGGRKPFVFAFTSDSRGGSGIGGGEREIEGANSYVMKKSIALAKFKDSAFMQVSGDMIDGYLPNIEQTNVEYRNWKRTIEPFAHYFPVTTSMGNHEAVVHTFGDLKGFKGRYGAADPTMKVDRFPFATDSAEAVYADQFVNPTNGLESEDGASYDPNPDKIDFPPYKENVFYYTYDNVAMVVLNSNYWYAPPLRFDPNYPTGNLHGYLMDNQLAWLEKTLAKLDADENLDFIFVTVHAVVLPNSGHYTDTMYYSGNNERRAVVKKTLNGPNLVTKGIIDQRDRLINAMTKTKKVIAVLTGDEHDFHWIKLTKDVNIYPENWKKAKVTENKHFRSIYQIHNGAAGSAANLVTENVPWIDHVKDFTPQSALVLFHVNGKSLKMEVINPDTLNTLVPLQEISLSKH